MGCVLNVQTNKTTCVASSTRSVESGNLDANGDPVMVNVSLGVFDLVLPSGRYVPFLRTEYRNAANAKVYAYTYSGQQAFSSSSVLLKESQTYTVSIFAQPLIFISSICNNLNGTYTIKGEGFGLTKPVVLTSGFSSVVLTSTDTYIVILQSADYLPFPLTVISKINGSTLVYSPIPAFIPYCSFP
jgi:hypothetical protein